MMKLKNLIYFLHIIVSVGILASCSSDDKITNDPVIPDFSGVTEQVTDVAVIDSGRYSWHEHYAMILSEAQQGNSEEDILKASYAKKMLNSMDSLTDAYIEQAGGNSNEDGPEGKNRALGYKYVTIRYTSVNSENKPIQLSELLVFPYNNIFPNPNPDNIVIGCHVTITSNSERPSNYGNNSIKTDVGMLACHAKSNGIDVDTESLVVIPDYEGYGATHGEAHPYLYQSLTARQVVDGVIAAKQWFESNEKNLDSDWRSYSVGYSQGGSVSMAVHKYIEKNGLTNSLRYIGSICGDGPYDPIATLKEYISTDKVYMPVAVGLIVKGMCDCNPYIKGKYKLSDYFTDSFLSSGIEGFISKKEKTTDQIQEELLNYSMNNNNGFYMMAKDEDGKFLKYTKENEYKSPSEKREWKGTEIMGSYCEVEQMLRPEMIQYFSGKEVSDADLEKCKALYKALEMNVITNDWTPSAPTLVFHSTRDEVVPFVNYTSVAGKITSSYFKGIKYVAGTYTHVSTGSAFYAWYETDLAKSLLNGKWKSYSSEQRWGGTFW